MKKSSISSSTSTTTTPTPPALILQRPTTSTTATSTYFRTTPAIIPLDYNYSTMSPSTYHSRHSTTASRQTPVDVDVDMDVDPMQYSSLFGDPVPPPPPTDFLGTPFSFRPTASTSIDMGGGSSEDEPQPPFGHNVTPTTHSRLFSDVPYSSSISRRFLNNATMRNFDVLPHLKPPDIQILPNSSGGSSSEPRDSPNFALLTPNEIQRRPTLYDIVEPEANMLELAETMSVSDATGRREYSEATRRVSNFAEDFKSNVGSFSHSQMTDMSSPAPRQPPPQSYARQCSNESYSSNEWFRPATHDFPEFSKMPKLRPSSKNVISIKRDEMHMQHSPVAAMINDSNGSSSGGEERLLDTTQTLEHPTVSLDALAPARPPDPSPSCLREMETDSLLSPQEYLKQRRKSTLDGLELNFPPLPPPAEPPPPVPPAPVLEGYELMPQEDQEMEESKPNIKREMSPVILKDLVATGGDYRIDQPRSHKKSAFTIIADRSPQTSGIQSPTAHLQKQMISAAHLSKEPTTTSSSSVTKPVAKPRYHLQHRSLTSTQLKLPRLAMHPTGLMMSDDSPRPSVQFNMTGRHSPSKMPQKGILQHRESLTSSQDTPLPIQRRRPSSTLPPVYDPKMKSCEALPFITDPYRTAIPRLHRSSLDLGRETAIFPPGSVPRPIQSNPNPTRQQRGLLRIINSADSTSRIPLRSNWISMDDLLVQEKLRRPSLSPLSIQNRRRSSSTSPERRSSTLTASDRRSSNLSTVTTSDFSFRRPSLLLQPQRKKSIAPGASPATQRRESIAPGVSSTTPRRQSIAPGASPTTKRRQSIVPPNNFGQRSRTARTKIAKPTTLSPIIGTPNKDSSTPQSPTNAAALSIAASDTLSDVTSRRDSLSKIPIRNGVTSSQSNSRMNSQPGSRVHSRSSSPLKEFTAQLPLSGRTSRATSSRSPSRATVRSTATSRANSRAPSRSTSRASTRPISRGPPSRASSRPNSRMELAKELANSRSNSRLSFVSNGGTERVRAGSVSPSVGIGRQRRESIIPDRRKSISLSPHAMRRHRPFGGGVGTGQQRRSISPPGKARSNSRGGSRGGGKEKTTIAGKSAALGQRRDSRSRIPTRARSGVGGASNGKATASSSKSPPKPKAKSKATTSPPRKPPIPQRKSPSSAKKVPGSVQKPESSVKRTPSSVGKQATAAKKQPSSIQKPGSMAAVATSLIKREASNLQRKPPIPSRTTGASRKPAKREASSLSMKKAPTDSNGLKRQPSQSSKNIKKTTDTKVAPIVSKEGKVDAAGEKLDVAVSESNGTSETAVAAPASANTAGTPRHIGGGGGGVAKLKRQVSNVSLMRLGSRISLQSKKRSDSPLSAKISEEAAISGDSNGKQVSMSTAAITAQVTSSMANQHLAMTTEDTSSATASVILEKSQKTLENIQQKVTDATDEIHRTITDNLTDLKSMEQDMGKMSDGATSPTSSITTVIENKSGKTGGASVSRGGTAEDPKKYTPSAGHTMKDNGVGKVGGVKGAGKGTGTATSSQKSSPLPPTQPIEAAVSVLNVGDIDAAERNYEFGLDGKSAGDGGAHVNSAALSSAAAVAGHVNSVAEPSSGGGDDYKTDAKRRSPDGQGGSTTESGGGKTGSQEFLEAKDDDLDSEPRGCCHCCTKFCMPCRRSARCSRCCRRNKKTKLHDESEEPVLSATSSATTTNLEVIDETRPPPPKNKTKTSCWQNLNCCKRCRKKPAIGVTERAADEEMAIAEQQTKMETIREEAPMAQAPPPPAGPAKQSKCGLCLSKVFCCRSVNKVEATTGAETEVKKCCFCIPCRRKRAPIAGRGSAVGAVGGGGSAAWQDPEAGITATDASVLEGAEAAALQKQGCCKRFWSKLLCCCKKQPPPAASESRRASMKAPPPPAEDTRRKLHVDLIEFNSKMKGAIPVLPLWLAWFCAICNVVFPGLGTLLSGLFCLCLGIPRFSQYDSAKARVGALIINIIVAVSQLFCVLFCFVGWGWSIWWGTIMLKCARKLSKIKKVERLEMEEEKRQEAAAAAAALTAVTAAPKVIATKTVAAAPTTAAALPAESESAATKT